MKTSNELNLGKPKLDAIISFALKLQKSKKWKRFVEIVLGSRKRSTVIHKLKMN